jgi:hypothetical protein
VDVSGEFVSMDEIDGNDNVVQLVNHIDRVGEFSSFGTEAHFKNA